MGITRTRNGYRLRPGDAGDLDWRWNSAEGALGLKSKDGLTFELARQGIEKEFSCGRKSDPMPDYAEAPRRRAVRIDRILANISYEDHITLLCVYSQHNIKLAAVACADQFGDVAPIALQTPLARSMFDHAFGDFRSLNAKLRTEKSCQLLRSIWRQANDRLEQASRAYENARRKYDDAVEQERRERTQRILEGKEAA
jgi:hypothetical protein